MFRKTLFISLALLFILAGCATATPAPESMEMESTEPAGMMDSPTPTPAEMMEEGADEGAMDEMAAQPVWFTTVFTDARSGQTFTIGGFKGQVVVVETMAMWCPKCKQQQEQVVLLRSKLPEPGSVVFVGLDVDVNENISDLKAYVERNGFDWYYSVTMPETAREIGNLYGDQFLNPSATPMLIVDRDGTAHPLPFGIKSAEDLLKSLEPYL